MANKQDKIARFGRSALAVAVSMCFASVAYAQSSEGSIFGRTAPKAQVTVINLDDGSTRTIQAEGNGGFALSKLQPGRYKITSDGKTREVSVAIGSGTEVSFAEVATVTVTGSRTRSAIDVSSTESNTVFTAAEIQALPVGRNPTAVAMLAPGAVKGDADFNDLASIGGASVAENGYYINGFDVTNIRNFTSYANLPFDAIEQQQIKTGGYGAEFGRSLGGVVSMVTKRGTNTWKGGASMTWAPESLSAAGQNVANNEPTQKGQYTLFRRANIDNNFNYNVYAGGPLIKGKLFAFALLQGVDNSTGRFGIEKSTRTEDKSPSGLIKIDFLPFEGHRLEFTGIHNKRTQTLMDYSNGEGKAYATTHNGTPIVSKNVTGGDVLLGKYTGYITDDFTVSAQVGRVTNLTGTLSGGRVTGLDCPVVYNVGATKALGCWNGVFPSPGVLDLTAPENNDLRKSARLDLEYTLGDHTIRAGYDGQKFTSAEAGKSTYTGGVYWRYFVTNDGRVNGVSNATTPGGQYVRARTRQVTSGQFEVENTAMYVEDSWKVTKNVLLYGGLRAESFNNKNSDGVSFVKADNLLAPRLAAVWNVNGDASLKIYGNAGRYYIPVASNTNIRATRGEASSEQYYTFTGMDPRTAAPTGLSAPIGVSTIVPGTLPNPATVADTKLKPMSQDEYILGFQQALAKNLAYGVKYVQRKVNNGMDDFCGNTGITKWAKDKGFTKFDFHTMAQCMLMNPGNDFNINLDLNDDGKLVPSTIPASYLGLARYERTYNALELSIERTFDGKWGLQGSYTYSKSKGTAEGYVQSNLNQDDAGVTQDFDFGSFTDGASGYLPNDRTHAFKLFGTYQLNDNFRFGGNLSVASGRPTSCIGYVPNTVPDFYDPSGSLNGGSGNAGYGASSYYCLNSQGVTTLGQRGSGPRTPWTTNMDLQAAYILKMENANTLTVALDLFNVFNSKTVQEWNEVRDFSRSTSLDTSIAKPGQFNMNYRNPTTFQAPRAVRITARYTF